MIYLKPEHLRQMREHGERDYPFECCGLLVGRFLAHGAKEVVEVYPILNAREEEAKRNRFLIFPEEVMKVELYARERRMDVVGGYHSHPDHQAVPSAHDMEHAWPTYSYVIVSVRAGRAYDILSWEMEADRSRFRQEQVGESSNL
ncbi:MAG TPA: M67 family metallopeptidase [Pyrinomonadaceae bacterium]|jgi:proteasome lid subunit RPN8/RPN11